MHCSKWRSQKVRLGGQMIYIVKTGWLTLLPPKIWWPLFCSSLTFCLLAACLSPPFRSHSGRLYPQNGLCTNSGRLSLPKLRLWLYCKKLLKYWRDMLPMLATRHWLAEQHKRLSSLHTAFALVPCTNDLAFVEKNGWCRQCIEVSSLLSTHTINV